MIRKLSNLGWCLVKVRCLLLAVALGALSTLGCSNEGGDGNTNVNDNQSVNDNGSTNDNDNTNDNGGNENDNGIPDSDEVRLQFNFDPANPKAASALADDGTEYGFFGEKDINGNLTRLTQIDVILPSRLTMRSVLDQSERPSRFLAGDNTALSLLYDNAGTAVTAVYVAPSGQTSRRTAVLTSPASRIANQQRVAVDDLCAIIENMLNVTSAVLQDCTDDSDSALCSGTIAEGLAALEWFCEQQIEIVDTLADDIGQGSSLVIPLQVVVTTPADQVTPGTGVRLIGLVSGGTPPYLFDWSILDGSPSRPPITAVSGTAGGQQSEAIVTLSTEGIYNLRLRSFDSAGRSTFFNFQIVVTEDPGSFSVSAEAEVSDSNYAVAAIQAEASGGARPYTYLWALDSGPNGGAVTFADETAEVTTALFNVGGNYILKVEATDSLGAIASTFVGVAIVDPETSLQVAISFPECTDLSFQDQDTCVDLGDSIVLQAQTTNASGADALDYSWSIVEGQDAATITGDTTASATVTASGPNPETLLVSVIVTDLADGEVAEASVSIEIVPDLALTAEIFTDNRATLNQPELLIALVSGAFGELSYAWSADPSNTGEFSCPDDAPCDLSRSQSVLFTPSVQEDITINLTVQDAGTGESVTTSTLLEIATFSVEIMGGSNIDDMDGDGVARDTISRNTLVSYTAALSGDAPEAVEYEWDVTLEDEEDSLSITLIDDDAAVVQVLANGDGVFELSVTATQSDDSENSATNDPRLQITAECAQQDIPVSDAGDSQIVASTAEVSLVCSSDATTGRSYRWRSQNDQVSDADLTTDPTDSSTATFVMPETTAPLAFECLAENNATMCESADITLIYATPEVSPVASSTQTVLVGTQVTLDCDPLGGYSPPSNDDAALEFEWRRVSATGIEIDPPADFEEDEANGTVTFTAPADTVDSPLYFECRGVVKDPGGDLTGPFSASRAVVTVEDFDVEVVVQTDDPAPQGNGDYDQLSVQRIRLSNSAGEAGVVVFGSTLSGGSAPAGLFRVSLQDDTAAVLVLQGDAAPVPGVAGGQEPAFGAIELFDINDDVDLAFIAALSGQPSGGETDGVFLLRDGSVDEVAVNGSGADDETPSGKRDCAFDDVALADAGGNPPVVFTAQLDADENTVCDAEGIYSLAGSATTTVAEGDVTTIPGSSSKFGSFASPLLANDDGDIAFAGRNASGTVLGAFVDPITSSLKSVFRNNNDAADTGGDFGTALPADLGLSSAGTVCFQAEVSNLSGVSEGLFSYDGSASTEVVLNQTQSPEGFDFSSFDKVAINQQGNLAFIADGQLFYYIDATGAVVAVRNHNQAGAPEVRNGETILPGITLDATAGLSDVQINDQGLIVFSVNFVVTENPLTLGTAILVATPVQ